MVVALVACGGSGVGISLSAAGSLLCLCLGVEYVLLCGSEGAFDVFDCSFDACEVGVLVCFLEFGNCLLDGSALVGRNLVAEFLELFSRSGG